MITSNYLQQLQIQLSTNNAREHSYRPALKALFESLNDTVTAINEPKRSEHGAPDFIFQDKKNKDVVYGYAETKDIYVDLDEIEQSSQLKRYFGYNNLILTNYLEFRFYKNGAKYQTIVLATKEGEFLRDREDNFTLLEREIVSFLHGEPEPIKNAKRLAEIMGAGMAARIRRNVERYLQTEDEKNLELVRIYEIMKKLLVPDLKIEKFADMYAQTLVYGLFVARYYDKTPENFSRQEARDLIPESNPFLQQFFDHIVGPKFDNRLGYIVDELCDVFRVSDVQSIIQIHYNLFGETLGRDPIIHFYEDFLKEYDPELRRQMGAYYTPVPVVSFIINAIDELLKSDFGISEGIASTEKITRSAVTQGLKTKETLHKVQILDPAVGTATFLNEIIKHIHSKFDRQEGLWPSYVDKELLPRLYGFELMMAPYTIAHLKLAMTLKDTGIDHFNQRLGVYLTNTLDEGAKVVEDLFSFGLAEAISDEARAANVIKHEKPIMVIVGNPPYSGESSNKGEHAMKLVEKYKFEPGGKEKLKERNPKWINDDYVKFIAFAQDMIEKNGEGIVAMITNHGYLDNPTFRGMRWSLLKSFNKIFILDLHGNSKKKEVTLDGGKDDNVFDVQQGVSIIVALKKDTKNKLAEVYRADLRGKRKAKFEYLETNSFHTVLWEKIRLSEPMYSFVNKNEILEKEYKEGVPLDKLFGKRSVGIVTGRDSFVIDGDKTELSKRISDMIRKGYIESSKVKETEDFNLTRAKILTFNESCITQIAYRPFDYRYIYYTNFFVARSRKEVMRNFIVGKNIGIMVCRQQKSEGFHHVLVHDRIVESSYLSNRTSEIGSSFPLYIYPTGQKNFISKSKEPNLDYQFVKKLLKNIDKYSWISEEKNKKLGDTNLISPLDILDYAYATLHSFSYREKFNDFLKSDFPRIPIARDKKSFWKLVELGGNLRRLHLLEDISPSSFNTSYPHSGKNLVGKIIYLKENVHINEEQFFGNIPQEIWDFYIGAYQPAQKWLKDRKGKILEYEDITHYQKIIFSIQETIKVMNEIDLVI